MDKRWNKIIVGLLALLLALNVLILFKVYNLDTHTEDLALRTAYIENDISNISNNITDDITSALEKENSLINEFKYNIGDIVGKNVSLELKLLPKTYSPENKCYFSLLLNDGTSKLIDTEVNSANYLISTIEVPFQGDIELNYIEETKDGRKIEKLETIYDIEDGLLAPFNSTYSGQYHFYPDNNQFVLGDTFEIYYDFAMSSYKEDKGIESADIYLSLDGKVLDSLPMKNGKRGPSQDSVYTTSENVEVYKYAFKDYRRELKKDDVIEIYAIAKHSKGFKVKIPLGKISNDSAEVNMDPEVFENNNSIIFED